MSETLTWQTLLDLEPKLPPVTRLPRIIRVEARVLDVPIRKHRKKRIAKKWLKKHGTKTVIDHYPGNKVLIHGKEGLAFCRTEMAWQLEAMQRELEQRINAALFAA